MNIQSRPKKRAHGATHEPFSVLQEPPSAAEWPPERFDQRPELPTATPVGNPLPREIADAYSARDTFIAGGIGAFSVVLPGIGAGVAGLASVGAAWPSHPSLPWQLGQE
jgi:hypothetical protein